MALCVKGANTDKFIRSSMIISADIRKNVFASSLCRASGSCPADTEWALLASSRNVTIFRHKLISMKADA